MKRRARNSRVTGPKIRVPIGSPWRLIKTAALRSKRIALPSSRRGFRRGRGFSRTATAAPGRRVGRPLDDHPGFTLRDRAAFLDLDRVAGAVTIVLVVRGVLLRARDEFLVDGVHEAPLDAHDDRLVAGVADDDPLENAFRHINSEPWLAPGGAAHRVWS